ncbi:MAG: hypothetical protein RIB47_15715 [Cyclobacteriaceae bacterium]
MRAEVFNIERKRDDQVSWSKAMTPNERLLLCLDLIDLSLAIAKTNSFEIPQDDTVPWITLKLAHAKPNS